MHISCKVKRL